MEKVQINVTQLRKISPMLIEIAKRVLDKRNKDTPENNQAS